MIEFSSHRIGVFLAALGLAATLASCSRPVEHVEFAASAVQVLDRDIDEDPFRLLPAGAVGWGRVDVRGLTETEYGPALFAAVKEMLPLSSGGSLVVERDLDSIAFAAYGTVGFEGTFVARGRFDVAALDAELTKESEKRGDELRKGRYAGRTLFTAPRVSVAVLTPKTVVLGTEKGVRRVLERIEEGRLERALPKWMEQLLENDKANFALGLDLDAQVVPSVLRTRLGFLDGLRAARLLGNYAAPGLNLAGTLTYDKPDSASKATKEILERAEQIRRAELLLMVLRMPRPFRRVDAAAAGRDAQIAVEVESRAIGIAIERRAELESALSGQ